MPETTFLTSPNHKTQIATSQLYFVNESCSGRIQRSGRHSGM